MSSGVAYRVSAARGRVTARPAHVHGTEPAGAILAVEQNLRIPWNHRARNDQHYNNDSQFHTAPSNQLPVLRLLPSVENTM